jgi:hypothetical protein
MSVQLAILTPRLRGREHFWKACRESIGLTPEPVLHLWNNPDKTQWPNSGRAMNELCALAYDLGATHYMLLSDDDFLLTGWWTALMTPVLANPAVDFVYGDIGTCDRDGEMGRPWIPPAFDGERVMRDVTLPGAGIINMDVWLRAEGYPSFVGAVDQAMWAHAHAVRPLHVQRVSGVFYCHRQWSEQQEWRRADSAALARELDFARQKQRAKAWYV